MRNIYVPTKEQLDQAAILAEEIRNDETALTKLSETKTRLKANRKDLMVLLRGKRKAKSPASPTSKAPKAKNAATPTA